MKTAQKIVMIFAMAVICYDVSRANPNSRNDANEQPSAHFSTNRLIAATQVDMRAADTQSIAGIDSNHNGVRDDVERYIIKHFSSSQKAVAALMQLAKAYQNALLTSTDVNSAYHNARTVNRSMDCIFYVFAGKPNRYDVSKIIFSEQINTKDRFAAYATYEKLIGGQMFPLGKSDSSACDAKVDEMKN